MWAPRLPHGFAWYAGRYPTGSSASAADCEKHPASPVHSLRIATLQPRPYGHTDAFAIGPLSEWSLVQSSQTSGDACTVSRHTHQWYMSGCVSDELGTAGQWGAGVSSQTLGSTGNTP